MQKVESDGHHQKEKTAAYLCTLHFIVVGEILTWWVLALCLYLQWN